MLKQEIYHKRDRLNWVLKRLPFGILFFVYIQKSQNLLLCQRLINNLGITN